jgi:hypothetical protein
VVQVARGELELLRDSRSALSKLTSRVTKLKQVRCQALELACLSDVFHLWRTDFACLVGVCSLIWWIVSAPSKTQSPRVCVQELETVLGSESEMEMLYLARRAASQEPAQPPAPQQQEQQQQQEGDDPEPAPRRSSHPSHAASAPPAAEEHEESEDDAEELPAATGDAEEQPQQFAEVCTTVYCFLCHSWLFCCASRRNGHGDPSTCSDIQCRTRSRGEGLMLTPGSTVCGRSHACSRACIRCRGGHDAQ